MALKIYRLTRKIHKWTSIGFGVFLLTWLVSGIFHVVPLSVLHRIDRWAMGRKQVQAANLESEPADDEPLSIEPDYRGLRRSIPEAISILEADLGRKVQVSACSIFRLSDTLIYQITLKDGERHLIDAIKGIPAKITETQIKESAMAAAPPGGNIVNATLLNKRPYAYWGPVPVHRFIFDDESRTHVYVSAITGRVLVSSKRRDRLRAWMISLHKFEFLMLIWEREAFRKGALLLVSLIGLTVVTTGFYMALPVKWLRRLPWNRSETMVNPSTAE